MKGITAVKFRIILSTLLIIAAALVVATFMLGYNHLKTVGQAAVTRQADASASEDSISNLQKLQSELATKQDVAKNAQGLWSSSSLPQFDTEQSLRTIAGQLGIPIKNITFVNDQPSSTRSRPQSSSSSTNQTADKNTSSSSSWGTKNSRISFEFGRKLSYNELLRFYHAIETSTPKLRLNGITIPTGSRQRSINPGTLTLELATH